MMGGNLWQRSTLTANNGVYYLDTAAGPVKQMASPFKNIFEASRTYYLLFVYATQTTHQVYQLWLGAGLPMDYADKNVFLTRAFPGVSHFQFTDDHMTWPQGWLREYDPATGILKVTIDMGFPQFQTEFEQAEQDFCQPISFCTLKDKKLSVQRGRGLREALQGQQDLQHVGRQGHRLAGWRRLRFRRDVPGQFRTRRAGPQADGSARGLPQGGHPGLERAAGPSRKKGAARGVRDHADLTAAVLHVAKEVQRRRRWWR